MSVKTAVAALVGDGMRFDVATGSGHTVVLDSTNGDAGARPAELVGAALAGCTAMDVISILRKKRQAVTGYEVRVNATQADEHPNQFTRFDVLHVVEGPNVDPEAVRRAIELSATKYCAVSSTLASGGSPVHHSYLLRHPDGNERYAEVTVTGPHAQPAEAGASSPN
jgi:putative redox protein